MFIFSFALDDDNGVANTFDIPTFEYATCLSHNIFSGKLLNKVGKNSALKTNNSRERNSQPTTAQRDTTKVN